MEKFFLLLSIVTFSLGAEAHQFIQCRDNMNASENHLVLSLDKNQSTFLLSSNIGDDDPQTSGVIELCTGKLISNDRQEYWTRTPWALIKITIPSFILNQSSKDFQLSIESFLHENHEKDLAVEYTCYTSLFNKNLKRKLTTFCQDYSNEYKASLLKSALK